MSDVASEDGEKKLGIGANITWNAVGNFVYLFLQWVLTYVVVRILGYEEAGVFSLATALGNSFYCVAYYSMRNYQVSDVSNEFSESTYLLSRYATSAVSLVLCCGFALVANYPLGTFACIMAFMMFRISEAISDVYQGMMQKRSRMDYVGISFLLRGVLCFAAFTLVVVVSGNLMMSIAAMAASSYAVVLTYDRAHGLRERVSNTSMGMVGKLLRVCLPLAVYGFLFNTMVQIPRLFIEGTLGTEQLGYYTTVAMPVVVVQVSASFFFAPLVTPMAERINSGDLPGFSSIVKKVLLFIAALSVVAAIVFGLLGEPALILAFGESIAPYSYLLPPLVACTVLTGLALFLAAVIVVVRRLRALLVSSAVCFLLTLVGSLPFINAFGLNGASFILIVSLTIFCISTAIAIVAEIRQMDNMWV